MPTPAERLAAKKQRKRPKNYLPYVRKITWACGARDARVSLRLAMRDVAEAVGLSVSSYWYLEMGGDVCLTTARRVAAFFGKTVEELWKEKVSDEQR